MNMAIVGAGIAGLLTGYELLRNKNVDRVTVFERRKNISPRKHCAGIVSRSTLRRIPFAEKFVVNSYSSVTMSMLEGVDLDIRLEKDSIYKIDRVAHERYLIDVLRNKGIEFRFGTTVNRLSIDDRKIRIALSGEVDREVSYDVVVIAEGFPPRIARLAGLKAYVEYLVGLQAEVYLSETTGKLSIDRLYVVTSLKRFLTEFGWLIPVSDRKAVIGVASPYRGDFSRLNTYIGFFEKKLGIKVAGVEDVYGGVILRGHPIDVVGGRILGIGDAIGTVKSISGGGLYAISILSNIYGENIGRDDVIKRKVEPLVNELEKQYMVYKILSKTFCRIDLSWLKVFSTISVDIGNEWYFDHHENVPVKVILSLVKEVFNSILK